MVKGEPQQEALGAKRKRQDSAASPSSEQPPAKRDAEAPDAKAKRPAASSPLPQPSAAPPRRVAYFHNAELSVFEHGRAHRFKPFRATLAHALLASYGAYPALVDVMHPRLVTRTDMGQYHADAYLEILGAAQSTANRRFAWGKAGDAAKQEDAAMRAKVEEVFARFNVVLDPRKSAGAVFPGILDYCRLYTSGSLGCAARLCSGEADVAINWYGGMSHARGPSAHNGCYVNDTVLALLQLLHKFRRVLYVNLSGVHADAVEEAFYTTDRVLTVSFHLNPETSPDAWPGTGCVQDVGADEGEGFSVNVPLEPGADDDVLVATFKSVVNKARAVYAPQAVVLQCGGSLLSAERGGSFNVTEQAYADCARIVRDFQLPLLLLGGNGRNMSRTARMWAYVTMVILGRESTLQDNLIPESADYREYFAPQYEIVGPKALAPNLNPHKANNAMRKRIMAALERLRQQNPLVT